MEIVWQPAGTFQAENTMHSRVANSRVVYQTYKSKDYVHPYTNIKHSNKFLIIRVEEEEAVIGETKDATSLEEIFAARKPTMISVLEFMSMCESDDLTEMDKLLRDQLLQGIDGLIPNKDDTEEFHFFCNACRYIKETT